MRPRLRPRSPANLYILFLPPTKAVSLRQLVSVGLGATLSNRWPRTLHRSCPPCTSPLVIWTRTSPPLATTLGMGSAASPNIRLPTLVVPRCIPLSRCGVHRPSSKLQEAPINVILPCGMTPREATHSWTTLSIPPAASPPCLYLPLRLPAVPLGGPRPWNPAINVLVPLTRSPSVVRVPSLHTHPVSSHLNSLSLLSLTWPALCTRLRCSPRPTVSVLTTCFPNLLTETNLLVPHGRTLTRRDLCRNITIPAWKPRIFAEVKVPGPSSIRLIKEKLEPTPLMWAPL